MQFRRKGAAQNWPPWTSGTLVRSNTRRKENDDASWQRPAPHGRDGSNAALLGAVAAPAVTAAPRSTVTAHPAIQDITTSAVDGTFTGRCRSRRRHRRSTRHCPVRCSTWCTARRTLNLLGLVVNLNQVHLNITARPGAGNLLDNLLCAVTGLLDGPGVLSHWWPI